MAFTMEIPRHNYRQDLLMALFFGLCCLAMHFIPSPPRNNQGFRARGLVLEVDDSNLILQDRIKYGAQKLTVKVLDGDFKGKVLVAANELRAQLELDKTFAVGDKVWLVMTEKYSSESSTSFPSALITVEVDFLAASGS